MWQMLNRKSINRVNLYFLIRLRSVMNHKLDSIKMFSRGSVWLVQRQNNGYVTLNHMVRVETRISSCQRYNVKVEPRVSVRVCRKYQKETFYLYFRQRSRSATPGRRVSCHKSLSVIWRIIRLNRGNAYNGSRVFNFWINCGFAKEVTI